MSETKHTPTPWAVEELLGDIWIICPTDRGPMPILTLGKASPVGLANAAFIVRACNAHDEMVAALEKSLTYVQSDPAVYFLTEQIRAALAKAEAK